MEKDLVVQEQVTPAEVVVLATEQSRVLMDIVEKTKCYQNISGKKYLQVEAWETIGAFNRTHAETESIEPIKAVDGLSVIGYQARVQLWKNGAVVGGAIMPCFFTENCCKGKDGDAKHKACMSAAQTFATSKAYRMNFSYVAILAGFQPLPAEEVTEDMKPPVDKTQHWCKEHDTAFFKKGKMNSFAHPIEGTEPTEWCYERSKKPEAVVADTAQAQKDTEELWGDEKSESLVNLDWLKESLTSLQEKGIKAYSDESMLSYIRMTYKGIEGETINEIASKLDKGQAKHLVSVIQDALDKD
ncbi:hypothetical protein LCGC14_1352900 [marine sediment metagenome]|uniref:Uncharacterized protein n=1 Tax=marine sediment metagenome TaxID=412755 RepID=A0A0F9KAC1_9ZZZZ